MTQHRKPGFVLPFAVTLAVLLGLYVGAYYAMVEPTMPLSHTGSRIRLDATYGPSFRHWSQWVQFFAPVHQLDRRLRPHVWEPTP